MPGKLINGTNFNDIIVPQAPFAGYRVGFKFFQSNTNQSTADNDTINGNNGDDYIDGGAGNDLIAGGNGEDIIHGGAGNDTISGENGGSHWPFFGWGWGNIFGFHNEVLFGDAGDDVIFGGNGSDKIYGGADNDELHGDNGRDKIEGGTGNDSVWGDNGADRLEGNEGNDELHGGDGWDEVEGGIGNDTIYGDGDSDELDGNEGNDELHGGDGWDRIDGGKDNDKLFGDAGNDKMTGGKGNDTLEGGDGADTLTGGKSGSDTFVYKAVGDSDATAGGAWSALTGDLIKDFDNTTDTIDLTGLGGSLHWSAGAEANGVWFQHVASGYLFADTTGDGVADLAVKVLGDDVAEGDVLGLGASNVAPVITSDSVGGEAENTAISNVVYDANATDADADTITYSITGADAGLFTIDTNDGEVRFNASPNFEAPGDAGANNVYDIIVHANDGQGHDTTKAVAITVTNVNEAPVFTSAAVSILSENVSTALAVYDAEVTDVDGAAPVFSLSGDDAGDFTINSVTGEVKFAVSPDYEAAADADTNNAYNITVHAFDGVNDVTKAVTVTVADVNDVAPAFLPPTSVNVSENISTGDVAYDANTTDADGSAPFYSISGGADAAKFSINSGTGEVKFLASPDFETPGDAGANNVYDIEINAFDGTNNTAQNVSITVNDVDEYNVGAVSDIYGAANAVDENAAADVFVGLTGFAYDADGSNNTITYSLDDNAVGRFKIDSLTGAVTTTGVAIDYEANTSFDVTIRATSSDTSFSTGIFTIAVNNLNDNAPTFTSGGGGNFAENAVISTPAYDAEVDDVDGDPAIFTLSGDDAALFDIDAGTGVVTFKVAPNFEAPADNGGNNVYNFDVKAFDGVNETTQAVAVTVTNVNDVAPTFTSGSGGNFAENTINSAVAYDAAVTDPDGAVVTYTLVAGSDSALFTIDSDDGEVRFIASPDFENKLDAGANNVYNFTVNAFDGVNNTQQAVAVTVTDVDEFNATTPIDTDADANSVNENALVNTLVQITGFSTDNDGSNNTITYSLFDNAGGRFKIDAGTGVVTTTGTSINRETNASFNITIRASSSDGSTADQTFNIAVNDVNEFNVTTPTDNNGAANAVNENAVADVAVGITGLASDADATNNTVTYSLFDNAGGRFKIDTNTGVVTTTGTAINYETNTNFNITVRATSSGGSTADQVFNIAVNNLNDNSPVFSGTGTANFAENTVNTTVAYDANATDADVGSVVTYSLAAGGDSALFTIDSNDGEVRFIASPNFEAPGDVGANNVYNITVNASDGTNVTGQAVAITVTDVVEVVADPNDFDTAGPAAAAGGPLNIFDGSGGTALNGSNTGTDTIAGNGGNDTIYGHDGNDNIDGGNDNDLIYGQVGNDTINGGLGQDTIYGGSGNDTITDGSGGSTNVIYGGSGNDTISGGGSADTILGGLGDDRISGLGGADSMTGGDGADTFVYGTTLADATGDVIVGFVHGTDKIDVSAIDANTGIGGDQAFAFVAGATGSTIANSITWSEGGGNTTVRFDNNGGGADWTITLAGTGLGLTGTDFIL